MKIIKLVILASVWLPHALQSQGLAPNEESSKQISLSLEYRPRTELRRGYRSLPNDSSQIAFFTSHRARLNFDYKSNKFIFHTSFQDIRVWGDTDPRDATGKAQFYEFYVEPILSESLSVRIGRQRVQYDNERLFAENNWRQAGGQHDAVRFIYKKNKWQADVVAAYNQEKESEYGTAYQIPWDEYRTLLASFVSFKPSAKVNLRFINFTDEYTDPGRGDNVGRWKFTNGGRVEYEEGELYFTFAGYYQWGEIESGKVHQAYYLEPEMKWTINPHYTLRVGAQVFSGDANPDDAKSTAFLAQYGAFHRYNGRMDYTQKTVRTNEHEGIVNPYLIHDYKLGAKFKLSWESHILETQKTIYQQNDGVSNSLDKFYAWENDFRCRFNPNDYTELELAYMFLIPGETILMLNTGKGGSKDQTGQFLYVMVTWSPELINTKH
ncbi:alginate export family protein [Fulvivirga ligni]|uniref:alginate export family protein n=1 Tax=Fulvivirga ligni TaxID=2904246 RepID=UPI001F192B59|nr:alginate export family protein [Fulvivirga ligni]UII21506.1 alginate export family protein [Fulvivirga ligni]